MLILFNSKTPRSAVIEEREEVNNSNVKTGDHYPEHELSKTGDIFVNTSNLKISVAVSLPKIGVRWVDQSTPSKILVKNTDFVSNPVLDDDFTAYKNTLYGDLFWETADIVKSRVNPKNANLDFNLISDGKNHSFAFDLGETISNSTWLLRFKLAISRLTNPSSSSIQKCYFGISSTDQNGIATSNQHFIGLELRTSNRGEADYRYAVVAVDGASLTNEPNAFFTHRPAEETLLVEIIRANPKECIINLYSEQSVLIESKSVKCPENLTSLRYICGKNPIDKGEGTVMGTIANVKFYNVVTSA